MKLGKAIKRNGETYRITVIQKYVCYAENELGNRIRIANLKII